jgi:hypothetical protein
VAAGIAVVSYDLWLTYLPEGLRRVSGGTIEPDQGAWARFASGAGFVEVRVEHGPATADWTAYLRRNPLRDARDTTVHGRPALVGRAPGGGLAIAWLERPRTGVWIRTEQSTEQNLGEELLRVAASVRTPVGD